jgi:phosphate transport system permease protein
MKDRIFKILLFCAAAVILLLCAGMVYSLVGGSAEAFQRFGFFRFLLSSQWDYTPGKEVYGALPFLVGTVSTSLLALAFCLPFSLPAALFVGEYFKGKPLASILGTIIDLLAGIPSIVYGLWGFYVLRPIMAQTGLSQQGFGILTAAMVLSVMIIPYAASLSAEFIRMTPAPLKEGAYSLGATRAEVVRRVILPSAKSGIFSAYVLALGRALGETMAVTMLIGNTNLLPRSIADTGNTMASIIANQFGEAEGIKLSALIAIGLLLFGITALINLTGKMIMYKQNK